MINARRCGSWTTRSLAAVLLLGAAAAPTVARPADAQGEPSLAIVSPKPGEQVTTDDIEVTVTVENFALDCAKAGMKDEPTAGHVHAMIDGMSMAQLANFYCDQTFTIPGDGLTPGKHTLIIDLATHSHLDLMETAKEVEIDFRPATPVPLPEPNDEGTPGVELVSPTNGATVPPKFTVEVSPVNFTPSEGLEGKPNVPGYGHWHVFVDTTDPMALMEEAMAEMEEEMAGTPMAGEHMAMPMPAMVLMPGTNTFEVDLTAWGPGEHTIFVEPVQNDHTNFADFDHLEFTVTVD